MKMVKRIKDKWLRALRSNKYKQAKQCLHKKNGDDVSFCCLGVLCDLHSQETNHPWVSGSYRGSDAFLPEEVREWAGLLTADNPRIFYKNITRSISSWNDGQEKTFEELADMIEEQL